MLSGPNNRGSIDSSTKFDQTAAVQIIGGLLAMRRYHVDILVIATEFMEFNVWAPQCISHSRNSCISFVISRGL